MNFIKEEDVIKMILPLEDAHHLDKNMIVTDLCGEEIEIDSNINWRNNIIEWCKEPSVSHPDMTNEQYMLEHVMPLLRYMPFPSSQHLTKEPFWDDLAKNLYELDKDMIYGRMRITPNPGVCNYRLKAIRYYIGCKNKLFGDNINDVPFL